MGGGCLAALGRLTTRAFLRLGAFVASMVLRALAFLLFNVIGPFCLGMTREVIRRMMAAWRGTRPGNSGSSALDRIAYALTGGTLWIVGYVLVGMVLGLPFMIVRLQFGQSAVPGPAWSLILLVGGILFVVGAVVGSLAYGYEDEPLLGP